MSRYVVYEAGALERERESTDTETNTAAAAVVVCRTQLYTVLNVVACDKLRQMLDCVLMKMAVNVNINWVKKAESTTCFAHYFLSMSSTGVASVY